MKQGRVYLVGAGPGDPELLTLKAVRVLGLADVVLVDDLVNKAILVHVRESARVVKVGKRGGCRSTPQVFIEKLLVAEAKAGHIVVRLKGGDPFIFGRGGEEAETLRAAGVECEIVNGITSGLAAATSAGVPLTHRAHSRGVVFVTAHTAAGDEPDWRALSASGMTLVVYMGVSRCEALQTSLIGGGLAPSTPVAVVQDATLARERQLRTTLGRLSQDIAAHEIESPAIIVIGDVARDSEIPTVGHALAAS
ncbi:MAG TPA: uroporphyrinogen-III C-methyltransferase [Burkholderiales bacterium]|nr:uroporphyrinogen-III C-methyltransferase [Burkholderiales bacterium]